MIMGLVALHVFGSQLLCAHHEVIKTNARYTEFIESHKDKPLVIKVGASWCPPCQKTKPIFEAISNDPAFKHVVFAEVLIDDEDTIGAQHGVRSLPTVLYFKDGKKIDESVGSESFEAVIREKIAKHFSQQAFAQGAPDKKDDESESALINNDDVTEKVEIVTKPMTTEQPSFVDRIISFLSSIVAFAVDMLKQIGQSIRSLFA